MLIINEKEIQTTYGMKEAMRDVEHILRAKVEEKILNPHRTIIGFPQRNATILYMPSSDLTNELSTIKTVSIFPENPAVGKPTTQGVILVTDAKNGEHLALMNASYLTRLRTGALSGLATDRLAREDAKVLTVIGTGGMAFEQVLGVLEVRGIEKILLVNPTISKAERFKERLLSFGIDENIHIEIVEDVSVAVRQADIISCSTRSNTPVFNGNDVKPGTHVNGVGSYLPHMREMDHTFIKRCSKIVTDDEIGVKEEAGELIYANEQPDWSYDELHGELMDLVVGKASGREDSEEITFFKSVGASYFDLAVAQGVYRKAIELGIGVEVEV
ncbi:ornithine cyclodeaminase family protein [Sporosarcina highlanderae]|uniref:Ornithine cyclodeaminase family protein n=1 Tax=Sporosarcina highlanderae TaxID=3035916 RepID=A0ABT8JSF3_9BACL|nr:ornithine cyclodeaminase family protein [Sporosarcina highlanderae]MDN4608040.1 ornithine cyclodeaminase family protein [Sporosarcina highlanderae]